MKGDDFRGVAMLPKAVIATPCFPWTDSVIANAVKQSMTSGCMDCRATLAMALF
jgi:hypothetical protein